LDDVASNVCNGPDGGFSETEGGVPMSFVEGH